MIELQPFDRRWAATVLSWIASPEELLWWSGRNDFPLTDTAVFDQWHSDPDITPHALLTDQEIAGYGELWTDASEGSAELGRLVVAPTQRGRGLGRLMIERLVSVAHTAGARPIWVRVFPANVVAIRCYRSAGFVRASSEAEAALNAAQRYPFQWMVR